MLRFDRMGLGNRKMLGVFGIFRGVSRFLVGEVREIRMHLLEGVFHFDFLTSHHNILTIFFNIN